MGNPFSRTELIFGPEAMDKLAAAHVAVFGIGGVGSYCVEALARSGIGALDLVDNDVYTETNLNRQLYALRSTLGQYKTDAAAERIRDINPECAVRSLRVFYLPETADLFDFSQYDYVVDAVDTVAAKIALVLRAKEAGVPVISSMGAGNKIDPSAFRVADLYETAVDPLARVMRTELKKRGVRQLKVVYSPELPLSPKPGRDPAEGPSGSRRSVPGSCAFVPSAAGLILAGEVVKDLTGLKARMGL